MDEPVAPPAKSRGGVKGRSGPQYRPTDDDRKRVSVLAAVGIRQDDIAKVVINPATGAPLSLKTLRKHYGEELADAQANCIMHVHRSLFMAATDMDRSVRSAMVNAARYYLACKAGWKETVVQQMVGKDEGPIEMSATNMTREEVTAAVRDAIGLV